MEHKESSMDIVEVDTDIARHPSHLQLEMPPSPEYPPIVLVLDSETVRRLSGADRPDPIERIAAPAPTSPQRDRARTPPGIASTNRAKIYIALITGGAAIISAVITYLIARSEC